MGSVKTNAKIGVAPSAFNIAPDAMFLPSTLKRIFELPPHPPFNVESKTGKRAPAPRITNSTLNGGRGGRQPVLLYITFSNAKNVIFFVGFFAIGPRATPSHFNDFFATRFGVE